MEDECSGDVTWDQDCWWSGKMTLSNGKTAAFEIDGNEPIGTITEAARYTLKFLIENESLIRHKIAVSMRKLYNEGWLYENTLTPEELALKVHLNDAKIFDEGGGELFYEADVDLLAGHWVQVPIDAHGEIGEPEIHG